jgi:hypothetical protein
MPLVSPVHVQTRGPLCLFQAMRPHMVPGAKFAAISSVLGSIMEIDKGGKGAYGLTLVRDLASQLFSCVRTRNQG